jgi:flavodoxin
MVGIYFSGTGNTKHCVDIFMERYGGQGGAVSVERPETADAVRKSDGIVFAYPIYFSSLPRLSATS